VRFDQILQEVSDLQHQVEAVKTRLECLEGQLLRDGSALSRGLRARGLKVYRQNPRERLLIPPNLSPKLHLQFYEKMKKYSFRLFLRDLVRTEGSFEPLDLTNYCSDRVAMEYTRFLETVSAVRRLKGGRYRLSRPGIASFGPTLEWFVAQIFEREFASPAMFGVDFKETDVGGDYDVLAFWESRLVYVEVKSSPPKSIEAPEVAAFFLRLRDLIPDLALFFNDTYLRMRDKVVSIFEGEMQKLSAGISFLDHPERLEDEIYHIAHRIYILNSKRGIVNNFRTCLRDHIRKSIGFG
jgi:hypothetical protein